MHAQLVEDDTGAISPGSLVKVRDETWLVTSVEDTPTVRCTACAV